MRDNHRGHPGDTWVTYNPDLSTADTQTLYVPDPTFSVPVPSTIHVNQEPRIDVFLKRLALVLAIACMVVFLAFALNMVLGDVWGIGQDPSLWNTDTPLIPREG